LVLSILLVVLVSGAVLWVVDGERPKPTSEAPEVPADRTAPVVESAVDAALATISHVPPLRSRQPATSRRIPRAPDTPPEEPEWRQAPIVVPTFEQEQVASIAVLSPLRTLEPPLPRHRLRSAILLVVLIVTVGALLAAVVGVVVTALALGLRAAVTS
jgi:hypothetical protein